MNVPDAEDQVTHTSRRDTNYLFFYYKLEKANLYLDAVERSKDKPYDDRMVEYLLTTPVQEGGNWQGFVDLVKKYGVVPKDVMPETMDTPLPTRRMCAD